MIPNEVIQPLLKSALAENQLALNEADQHKLVRYLELMQTWNRVFNLTTITNAREMVYLHIIDSLLVQPFLQGQRLLDVGTGAGLPGIPLAIINPDKHWVLLDKNSKKTRFLTQTIAELELSNVQAVHTRSEDFQPAQCFDSILSRALGTLHLFAETTKHLLCADGLFIAMKGKYPQDELADMQGDIQIKDVSRLTMKGMDIERHIVRMMRT